MLASFDELQRDRQLPNILSHQNRRRRRSLINFTSSSPFLSSQHGNTAPSESYPTSSPSPRPSRHTVGDSIVKYPTPYFALKIQRASVPASYRTSLLCLPLLWSISIERRKCYNHCKKIRNNKTESSSKRAAYLISHTTIPEHSTRVQRVIQFYSPR